MASILRLNTAILSKLSKFALLLATCFFVGNALTPAYCQDESRFEFFPWESCLLLTIERIEQSGKDRIYHATIADVLQGRFLKRNPISVYVSSLGSGGESPLERRFVVGQTVLVAFNSLPPNRFRKHLKIYNEYFPLGDKDQNQGEIDKLKARLTNSLFPYRACVDATITKNKFVKKGCEACHPGRIDIEATINEVYMPDALSQAEPEALVQEKTIPKTFHASLRKGQKLKAFFYEDFARPLKKGQRYIWKFNPVYHDEKDPERIFLGLNGGTFSAANEFSDSQIQELKAQPERFGEYLIETKKHMQAQIEKSWTKEQIGTYVSKSELRYIPRTQGVVVTEGNVISGQLFESDQDKLGKVLWFSGLIEGKPCGEYQLQVHKGGANFWVLDSGYFCNPMHRSEISFFQKFFKDILVKCGITYSRVNNLKENKELMPGRDELVLQLNEQNQIEKIKFRLLNEKLLEAKVDKEMNLSDFRIDDAPSQIWQDAYSQRIDNMNKVWQETLNFEKW